MIPAMDVDEFRAADLQDIKNRLPELVGIRTEIGNPEQRRRKANKGEQEAEGEEDTGKG